ncbi:MAG: hypothetical protein MJ094_06205 [Saccharofermentans sp.]|nr:hypothetical protein [Saccharofermentans sp.]
MMTRKKVIRFTIETLLMIILSGALVIVGVLLTNNVKNDRVQNEYRLEFYEVLPAENYSEVVSPLIGRYAGINQVFEGRNSSGIVGYVLSVDIIDHDTGMPLSLLVGVNYHTGELTGIKRASEDLHQSAITDYDIEIINIQTMSEAIPVALGDTQEEALDEALEQTRLSGLNDGIYYAQSLSADNSGYIDYVEMVIENGLITTVQWNAFNTDMNIKNRRDSALDGVYSVPGLNWASQSYILCHALIDCQNPDLLAMKSDGTTDIIDGVTINIRTFYDLSVECIENSRADFDVDAYYGGLSSIIEELLNNDPATLGIINDEGNIVFSFTGYPSVFLSPEEGVGSINVRQRVTGDMTNYSDFESGIQEVDDESFVVGNEDGVRFEENTSNADSIDGLPISEIRTFIDGIDGDEITSLDIITAINTTYKFLKDYLNWMA